MIKDLKAEIKRLKDKAASLSAARRRSTINLGIKKLKRTLAPFMAGQRRARRQECRPRA